MSLACRIRNHYVPMTTDQQPPHLSRLELAAWRGMLEVHARVTQELDAQMRAEHGLSVSAYEVLMFLADAPEHRMRMSDIADRVLLSRSGCTRLSTGWSTSGTSRARAATTDGRGLYAQLTDAGLEKVTAARATPPGVRQFFSTTSRRPTRSPSAISGPASATAAGSRSPISSASVRAHVGELVVVLALVVGPATLRSVAGGPRLWSDPPTARTRPGTR